MNTFKLNLGISAILMIFSLAVHAQELKEQKICDLYESAAANTLAIKATLDATDNSLGKGEGLTLLKLSCEQVRMAKDVIYDLEFKCESHLGPEVMREAIPVAHKICGIRR